MCGQLLGRNRRQSITYEIPPGISFTTPKLVKKLIRVGLKRRLWDTRAVKGDESRAMRWEMQSMPKKYGSYGRPRACRRGIFVEGLMLARSKPVGDPSLAGAAARGESRVPNTRGGFKST